MNNSTLNLNITESLTDPPTPFSGLITSLFICFSSISVVFGLPTHFCVICLIVKKSDRSIALEFFNLNLSVCEIGICMFCVFKILALWFSYLHEFASFLQGLLVSGRPLFQCLICVERYLAVVHPVTFLKYKPLRYKVICSTVIWIMIFISCWVASLGLNPSLLYLFALCFLSQAFFTLSIKLFCCVAVLRGLKQSGPGERGREREEENLIKRRAFNFILITTVSMFIIYVLFVFSGCYRIMTRQFSEEPFLLNLVCFVFGGFVHPVLYLHRAGKLCCFSSS